MTTERKNKKARHVLRYTLVTLLLAVALVVAWWLVVRPRTGTGRVHVASAGAFTHFSFPRFTPAQLGVQVNLRSCGTNPNWIDAVAFDQTHTWVGTFGSGLWRRDIETGRWENVTSSLTGRSRDLIPAIAADEASVWVLAVGGVLNRYEKGTERWACFDLEGCYPGSVASRAGRVVVGGRRGILCSDAHLPRFSSLCESGREREFRAPCHVTDGSVWAVWWQPTHGPSKRPQDYRVAGVARYDFDRAQWERFGPGTGIDLTRLAERAACPPYVSCIVSDEGDLWVGTYYHGVFRYDRAQSKWTHLLWDEDAPLKAWPYVLDIAVSSRRVYFVPYSIRGCSLTGDLGDDHCAGHLELVVYDKRSGKIGHIKLPRRLAVTCAAQDGDDIWFGTADGSIWRLNEATGQWKEMLHGGHSDWSKGVRLVVIAAGRVAAGAGSGLYLLQK